MHTPRVKRVQTILRQLFIGELSWKRLIRSILLIPIFVYIGIFMLAWLIPDKLIFQPPFSSYKDRPEILQIPTADGESVAAIYYANDGASHTILFSHGNAEDIGHVEPFARTLQRAGFSVLTYDYRGYGLSEGSPSEQNAYQDIAAAYGYLVNARQIRPERIILHGRSLGGAVAADLAASSPVGGLVLESAFTSAARVLTSVRILPFDKFETIDKVSRTNCPVLIIHGREDRTIPFHHGEKLFAAANEPKKFFPVDAAGHNDLFWVAGPSYIDALKSFAADLPR